MLNVMVVDDSTIIRKLLTRELEKMGHTVVAQARNGKEAVDLYQKHLPDFVTMDITMPVMDGIESLKRIKRGYPDAKIIMVTSHGEELQVMTAITSGAKGYILKPIKEDKILEAIVKIFPDLYTAI